MPCFAEPVRPPAQLKNEAGSSILTRRRLPTETAAAAPARLSEPLRSGAEALGGFSLANVRVHRDSPEPAKLGALAFARGSDIHLGPGQEQHLPHEVWHVVQQKQGRVTATAQVDGASVSENVALETEADRMGPTAASLRPPAAGCHLGAAVSGPGIVQRRLFKGKIEEDKTKEWKPWKDDPNQSPSPIVDQLSREDSNYLIRDDCSATNKKVHVLQEKYYLIGESHSKDADDNWDKGVEKWPKVPKLVEEDLVTKGFMTLEYEEPKEEDLSPSTDSKGFSHRGEHSFDSIPVLYIIETTTVNRALNVINSLKSKWKNNLQPLNEALSYVGEWFDSTYPTWLARIPTEIQAQGGKKNEASEFAAEYLVRLSVLKSDLRALDEATGYQQPDAVEKSPEDSDNILKLFDCVAVSAQCIPEMIKGLARLVEMPGNNLEKVEKIAGGTKGNYVKKLLTETSPAREQVMKANMKKVNPPALIKTGEAHAEAIYKDALFKPKVISIPPLLPLEEATKRQK